MRRTLAVAVAVAGLAAPASALVWGGTASAGPAHSSIQCNKLSGTISGPITIKKCDPKEKAFKQATGSASALVHGGTLTWSNGETTKVGSLAFTQITTNPAQCPKKGSDEYYTTGTVTGGTSTYTKAGDALSSKTCVIVKTQKLSLAKGTTMSL